MERQWKLNEALNHLNNRRIYNALWNNYSNKNTFVSEKKTLPSQQAATGLLKIAEEKLAMKKDYYQKKLEILKKREERESKFQQEMLQHMYILQNKIDVLINK